MKDYKRATNKNRVDEAKAAIRRVFENTVVPPEATKASLVELRDELDILIDAIGSERKRE